MHGRRKLGAAAALAVVVALLSMPTAAAETAANGSVVRTWTSLAFDAVRQTSGTSDGIAARLYAMVDVAMYDAVNGVADEPHAAAVVPPSDSKAGDPVAAAARAAHDVLAALYPRFADTYKAQLARDLASVRSPGGRKLGEAWGAKVAAAVLANRANDGSTGTETQPAGSGIGEFRLPWNAQLRHLRPFAIDDPTIYVRDSRPPISSTEYADAYRDVHQVGGSTSDPEAAATFQYWKLSGTTNQPAGAWLQVAQVISADRHLSLGDTARLFALESMAMADTVAPTYDTKATFHSWRPETAIREPDDGNPLTDTDTGWTARGGAAGSPEHWSGHSSFSAAGAEVLAGFFCRDDISFTLATDLGGPARTFPSLSVAATQAGRSRVLGGQHFEFSNQAGLRAGRAIADEVLATTLLPAACAS